MYSYRVVLFACLSSLTAAVQASTTCTDSGMQPLDVRIDTTRVIRAASPKTLFGFSVDWFQFQEGHVRDHQVRPETIQWLAPFPGATYRYSAGNEMDWSAMVGPLSDRRKVYANYHGYQLPVFGPEEFLAFLREVSGRGIFLMDVAGKRYGGDLQRVISDNGALLAWMQTKEVDICGSGRLCSVDAYELGNEVDWEKGMRWPGPVYAEKMEVLLTELTKAFPNARFVANGRTVPWSAGGNGYNEPSFDTVVASRIGTQVAGATIHTYYDGIPVSQMQPHISRLANLYAKQNPSARVFVTEHGRWPSDNRLGRWESNWYQASGGWGGISAADFVLMLTTMPIVEYASWHSISVSGPWQLFRWNRSADLIYPSATYWALRAVRDGYLDDVVDTQPAVVRGGDYEGGYRLRLVGMRDAAGRASLLGVNRSRKAVLIHVEPGQTYVGQEVETAFFTSDPTGADNSDTEPYRYQIQRGKFRAAATGDVVCVPPLTAFSVLYQR